MRRMLAPFVALFVFISLISAEEYTSKISKIKRDGEDSTITITVDGKQKVLSVDKTATFHKKGKGAKTPELPDGLKSVKEGVEATIFTDTRDGKEVVTKIVVGGKKKD
ncbi:hypothetical protein KIH39_20805 [Telmatocola sphagniphila]|uniref:Uncharacterized protein n=1 Tax=Telmatocola sphagniphila TaxID=1123043 RepID=A0A8E6B4N3_9BACT|nr:hypothetical protein [Telmatocola sphagniphila]QVL31262.1 hypothetical protein KIH39_20805 [Telmatocola sphagniphila]